VGKRIQTPERCPARTSPPKERVQSMPPPRRRPVRPPCKTPRCPRCRCTPAGISHVPGIRTSFVSGWIQSKASILEMVWGKWRRKADAPPIALASEPPSTTRCEGAHPEKGRPHRRTPSAGGGGGGGEWHTHEMRASARHSTVCSSPTTQEVEPARGECRHGQPDVPIPQ
jgi:hypothetical protein